MTLLSAKSPTLHQVSSKMAFIQYYKHAINIFFPYVNACVWETEIAVSTVCGEKKKHSYQI